LITLASKLINEKDISQKLLLKKIAKSKTVDELIDEVRYFESVYCVAKTVISHDRQVPEKSIERPILLGNIKYLNKNKHKSHRKGSLFKLDLSKSKKQSSSLHFTSNSYLSDQQRLMSCTIQLASSVSKKFNSTYFTNRRPSINNQSRVQKSNLKGSRISEESSRTKSIKKIPTPKGIDDDQLLQKIRSKKKLQNHNIHRDPKAEESIV
jgi:hypothetical protein